MRLKLDFDMDGAWFQDNDAHAAAGQTLDEVARLLSHGLTAGLIKDGNGNTIGSFKIVADGEHHRRGGVALQRKYTAEQRREHARHAANIRWARRSDTE